MAVLSLGVDGCPAGWIVAEVRASPGCGEKVGLSLGWTVHEALGDLLRGTEAAMTVIDVPIGLSDGPPRPCDRQARLRLGPRRASVFTPPMRGMLGCASQAEATAYGQARRAGGGLSAQAWNIVPKIREADAAVSPEDQDRWREGHPELAFARLAGAPMAEPKRSEAGRAARLAVLRARGLDPAPMLAALADERPRRAAPDDALDACVLALTGLDALAGRAWVLGGERDGRGLRMEVLG